MLTKRKTYAILYQMEHNNAKLHSADRQSIISCELVSGIDETKLFRLFEESSASLVRFNRAEDICNSENYEKQLFIIVRGSAAVHKQLADGRDLLINRLHRGSIFGMAGLFTDESFPTKITAQTDSLILILTKQWVVDSFEKQPKMSLNYISILSDKIQFLNRKLSSFATVDAKEKLYDYLLRTGGEPGEPFSLPCSISELARILGMGRTSVYRSIEELEEEKRIKRTGKLFTIY